MNKYGIVFIVSSIVVVADQLTKYLVRSSIPLYQKIEILPFLGITHLRNKGVAFGMLRSIPDEVRMPFFVFIFCVAFAVVFYIIRKVDNNRLLILALSLILGGAIGNSIDRFRLGYVTDFILLHWFGNPSYYWPPFNIADSCITVGAVLVFFISIFHKEVW